MPHERGNHLRAFIWPLGEAPWAMVTHDDPTATPIASFALSSRTPEAQLVEIRVWINEHHGVNVGPIPEEIAYRDNSPNLSPKIQGFSFTVPAEDGWKWREQEGIDHHV